LRLLRPRPFSGKGGSHRIRKESAVMKTIERSAPEALPGWPEPLRVLVREVPAPGAAPVLGEVRFEDPRSIAAARRSRPGGYLRLPVLAARAVRGTMAVVLGKVVEGTDLILRVRFVPVPSRVRIR
jgi:hypothetical protein